MTQLTISGQVLNGRILPEQSLAPIEGQRFVGTLTVVPKESANGETAQPSAKESGAPPIERVAAEECDPEPPEWLDIENDVYFPIKVPRVSLGKVNIRVRKGKPSIILPEELPDE